jgi:TonB family protein
MQEKDKNRNDYLSDFLRYHGNEMKDQERNAFERSLQQDPFAEEASEGFAQIDPSQAENDISELRKRLNRKTPAKRRKLLYRVAAILAGVMILTSILTIDWREKPAEKFAQTPEPPVMKEISPLPAQRPDESGIEDQQTVMLVKKELAKTGKSEEKSDVIVEKRSEVYREVTEFVEEKKAEQAQIAEESKPFGATKSEGIPVRSLRVRGKIISSEDNQPLPGASVTVKGTNQGAIADTGGNFALDVNRADEKVFVAQFVGMKNKEFNAKADTVMEIRLDPSVSALNETVVVGYGVRKRDMLDAESSDGYISARPENGKAAFDRYIRNNMKRPENTAYSRKEVVVLSFVVDKAGRPDSIKVVKSPGRPFSDEALRLIREGPAWKPALENGQLKKDEITIRIVFK